jgi:RHS repeat-associated protein
VFDDLGGSSILLFPDGRQEEHTWDLLGRVERIRLVAPGVSALGGNTTPGSLIAETAYSGPARAWWIRQGNGVVSQWHYDDADRLVRLHHRGPTDLVLESAHYRHDAAGRRRVSQLIATPARTVVHQFDAASRLTAARWGFDFPALADADTQPLQEADIAAADGAAAGATDAEVSQLDASDTRLSTSTTIGAATTNVPYVSFSGHRIVSAGAEVIGYDADGNRTHDAARLYTYDALGRCVAVRDAATQNLIAEIVYDPLGRISGGDRGFGPFRRYFFGSAWLQEEDGAAIVTRQRTVHSTLSLTLTESLLQGAYCRHEDGHRDLVLVTGTDGAPVERYRYSPFGVATVLDASGSVSLPDSAIGLEPTFGGMAHWPGPQLFTTPRRLYDARLGIFTSRDPELYTTSPSPYVFARHDPVNFIDPAGDTPAHVVAGLVVGAVGLVGGVAGTYFAKPDADFWDYAAAGSIGFGAGFLTGATFGAAASGASSLLLNAGLGAAKVGNVAVGHVAVPVLSGVIGGAATSGTAGLASGAAMGLYQGYRHGSPGGDPWEMAVSGAGQEAFAGAVAGGVGGGMFGGLLRAGALPRGALRSIARGGSPTPAIWARSIVSPYGLGAGAIGYQSSVSGSVARQWIRGEDVDPFSPDVQRDALLGVAFSQAVPLISPRSRAYWIIRRDPLGAAEVLRRHGSESSGRHHMRSVASYPELAVDPKNLRPYATQEQHARWHREWDIFPDDPSWRSTQTHGPYMQSWPAPFGFRVPQPSAGGKPEKP